MQLRKKFTQLYKNIHSTSTLHIFLRFRNISTFTWELSVYMRQLQRQSGWLWGLGKGVYRSHFHLVFMHNSLNNGKKCEYHLNYSGIAIWWCNDSRTAVFIRVGPNPICISTKWGIMVFRDDAAAVDDENVRQRGGGGGQAERQSLCSVLTYFLRHEHKLRSFLSPTTYTQLTS